MHLLKNSVAIVFSTFLSGFAVHAATLLNADGPAEIPPASYAAKQYVDTKGCVYVKAGVGNSVTWVPRVTRSRELVCGYRPSLQTLAQPAAVKNVPTVAPLRTASATQKTRPATVKQTAASPVPRLPKGYKPVWDDGRLNPRRGFGTESGKAEMRKVWTDTVPMKLVPENGQDVKLKQAHIRYQEANGTGSSSRTATGTKSVPKTMRVAKSSSRKVSTKSGGRLVQVAAFGVAGNAQTTANKFHQMGLPVVLRSTKYNGKNLNVLYLGPFARNADIKVGLNAAHTAGFKDAFVK